MGVCLDQFVVLLFLSFFKKKGACSDQQPHPPIFCQAYGNLVPEHESYLEGYVCEVSCTNSA